MIMKDAGIDGDIEIYVDDGDIVMTGYAGTIVFGRIAVQELSAILQHFTATGELPE